MNGNGLDLLTGETGGLHDPTRISYLRWKDSIQQIIVLKAKAKEVRDHSLQQLEENQHTIEDLENRLRLSNLQNNTIQKQLLEVRKMYLENTNQGIRLFQAEKEILEDGLKESELFKCLHDVSNWRPQYFTSDCFKQLQQQLDLTYHNFTGHLRSVYPKITDIDMRVCCLLKIQVPVRGIAALIGREPSTVTKIRKKLFEKFFGEPGTTEQFDAYIMEL